MANRKQLRIVFSVILSDAGETTRALEIAEGLRTFCPQDDEVEIIFLSTGSRFEQKVTSNGFKIHKCLPSLPGISFHQDLKTTKTNLIGDVALVHELLVGEMQALEELKPDVVIHGFYPIASLARRMIDQPILGICYLPIPLQEDLYGTTLMKDVPDMIRPLTYLPAGLRRTIVKSIPKALKLKAPIFQQTNILEALKEFNWKGEPVRNLFNMLKSDFTIINDFEEFYKDDILPKNYKVVGPLYAPAKTGDEIDPNILNIFSPENKRVKIFCTLGSSGKKQYLLEAIKALAQKANQGWSAVVLAPPSVCPIKEAIVCAENSPHIYITDSFVPAPLVNAMADVVLCHGGQGTIQTAIASGTPLVGFAMQPEQQINLDNVVMRNAGIRIPIHKWNAHNIQSAITTILAEPSYQKNINQLKISLESTDGKKNAALSIWEYITSNLK